MARFLRGRLPEFWRDNASSGQHIPLQTRVEHLTTEQRGWGIPPTADLAAWYRQQDAAAEDAVIVRVLNVFELDLVT